MSREELLSAIIDEVRAGQVATDALDQAVADHVGLNRTDMRALDVLDRRGRLTAGELSEAMHLTTGAITSVLDRLEKRGWAKRVRDSDDRRRVLVEISAKVRRLGEEIYGSPETAFSDFPEYTEQELELLLDWTRRGREWTESRIALVQSLPKTKKYEKRLTGRGRA